MWKKRKNTVECSESNRTADNNCMRTKKWSAWRKAFGKWHKSHQHLPGATSICLEGQVQSLRCPVHHRKDFRLHNSLSLREGNTSSFLEQDIILPSGSRFQSGMNSLSCSIGPAPCSGGNLKAISYRYHLGPSYPPLSVTFMGSFDRHLSGQDRTEQCLQSTFVSKHAHQQSQNYWRDGPTNSSASLCCGCMQCGRACIPQQGQNSLRTSRWEPL